MLSDGGEIPDHLFNSDTVWCPCLCLIGYVTALVQCSRYMQSTAVRRPLDWAQWIKLQPVHTAKAASCFTYLVPWAAEELMIEREKILMVFTTTKS